MTWRDENRMYRKELRHQMPDRLNAHLMELMDLTPDESGPLEPCGSERDFAVSDSANTFQNRRVSSAAPDTTVCPSGEMEVCRTLDE